MCVCKGICMYIYIFMYMCVCAFVCMCVSIHIDIGFTLPLSDHQPRDGLKKELSFAIFRLLISGLCTSSFYYWHHTPPLFRTPRRCGCLSPTSPPSSPSSARRTRSPGKRSTQPTARAPPR